MNSKKNGNIKKLSLCLILASVGLDTLALEPSPENSEVPSIEQEQTQLNSEKAVSISSIKAPPANSLRSEKQAIEAAPASSVEKRQLKELALPSNFFAVQLYKPNYLLPYYYTGSPDNAAYESINRTIGHNEAKFQISFKVPLWKNIFNRLSTVYLGYTQLSYWQVYTADAFFRETDYQPEIFLANIVSIPLIKDWAINSINLGVVHQSNGFGGTMERSWNRAYLEATTSLNNWFLSVKPWYVFPDSSIKEHNPDIAHYLGYGSLTGGYKLHKQVFALEVRNLTKNRYQTGQFTWSFPLTSHLKGYFQFFSGYGQSLIEYNHRTNSVGLGLALNDWV